MATAPTAPAEKEKHDDPMKYKTPPVEERVPDAANGPMIGETPEEYTKRKEPKK